jgi:hypothetical protein
MTTENRNLIATAQRNGNYKVTSCGGGFSR